MYPPCIEHDPIKIVARTPISGYTPQQTINFEFYVNNQSNVKVNQFIVELIQVNIFDFREKSVFDEIVNDVYIVMKFFQSINYSKRYIACGWTHRYDEEFLLYRKTLEGCDENQQKFFIVDIEIPDSIPPTDFITSNLMKVTYFIRVCFLLY